MEFIRQFTHISVTLEHEQNRHVKHIDFIYFFFNDADSPHLLQSPSIGAGAYVLPSFDPQRDLWISVITFSHAMHLS